MSDPNEMAPAPKSAADSGSYLDSIKRFASNAGDYAATQASQPPAASAAPSVLDRLASAIGSIVKNSQTPDAQAAQQLAQAAAPVVSQVAQAAAPIAQAVAPALAPALAPVTTPTVNAAVSQGIKDDLTGMPWYGQLGLGVALIGTVAFGVSALRKK